MSGDFIIAGVDEAGRGPLAGPVVSAAVILKAGTKLPGLADSKKLKPSARTKLFDLIIKRALDFSITIVSHLDIDRLNISHATRWANFFCIESLRIKPDLVLIDGNDKQILNTPFKTVIGGDGKIRQIMAASILAKVTRDKIMEHYSREFPNYGFEKHMGYGTRLHRTLLESHGPCEIHRNSYNWRK